MQLPMNQTASAKTYVITGPTSGIGRQAALELAKHGTVVLLGRNRTKLEVVQKIIQRGGRQAYVIVCDLSDMASVRNAAAEIVGLGRPINGLLNNAGVMQMRKTTNAQGWDTTFATNHLGPFALAEELIPHLPDGANVLFVVSAVEDPERKPAVAAGFRGGRFISVAASAQGQWRMGGSTKPGMDAYATSKQSALAATMALARETARLRINAVEPGLTPATRLGARDANAFTRVMIRILVPLIVPLLMPFIKILSTPRKAARVLTGILTNEAGPTGTYFDQDGRPMRGSALASDPEFQQRVILETRAFLKAHSAQSLPT